MINHTFHCWTSKVSQFQLIVLSRAKHIVQRLGVTADLLNIEISNNIMIYLDKVAVMNRIIAWF